LKRLHFDVAVCIVGWWPVYVFQRFAHADHVVTWTVYGYVTVLLTLILVKRVVEVLFGRHIWEPKAAPGSEVLPTQSDQERQRVEEEEREAPATRSALRRMAAIFSGLVGVQIVVALILLSLPTGCGLVSGLSFITIVLIMCAYLFGLLKVFKSLMHRQVHKSSGLTAFKGIIILGLIMTFILFLTETIAFSTSPAVPQTTAPPDSFSDGGAAPEPGYPVCRLRWGTVATGRGTHGRGYTTAAPEDAKLVNGGITVNDFGVFANAVYQISDTDMDAYVAKAIDSGLASFDQAVVEYFQPAEKTARIVRFRVPSAKVDVISVRGTKLKSDWAFNVYVWGSGIVWNVGSQFLPFSRAIPVNEITSILSQGIFDRLGLLGPEQVIEKAIEQQINQSLAEGFTPMITGHSMGGGLAKAVGAKLGIQTVVFSPIGMTYSAGRIMDKEFRNNLKDVVSIVPERDLVPVLEPQQSMVQYTDCNHPGEPGTSDPAGFDPLALYACHKIDRTMLDLAAKCKGQANPSSKYPFLSDVR